MTCCDHCADAEGLFGDRAARRDLRRFRRKGPNPATRQLLEMLPREEIAGGTLLDVGGGVGAIQHELLAAGMARAVQVDASAAYLRVSREEGERRGHAERVEYRYGDFVELAPGLDDADVVTMDRVVCCYPDMPRLVEASTSQARLYYGLTYPRKRLGTRIFMTVANLFFRLRGSAFRTYIHSPAAIAAEIQGRGFRLVGTARTFFWHVALYRRA